MNLGQIEDLFIEKLTEKYRLTQRDIKRAFARFDKDNSGHLSVAELTDAIHLYLNGVDKRRVVELVQRYDVDGDGHISLDEFSGFLMSRNSADQSEWMRVDHLVAPRSGSSVGRTASLAPSHPRRQAFEEEAPDPARSEQYEAQVYLQQLRGHLTKLILDKREAGGISFDERKEHKTSRLVQVQARAHIRKLFAQYISPPAASDPPSAPRGVSAASFARVLRRVNIPGMAPPADEVLSLLAASCAFISSSGEQLSSPEALVDLMFDEGGVTRNQFGFTTEVKAASDTSRPTVAEGPLRTARASDMPEANTAGRTPHRLSEVARRFMTKRCRNTLAAPSSFDMRQLERSARAPQYLCVRDHVFGLSAAALVASSECIHTYPAPVTWADEYDADGEACVGEGMGDRVVYCCASLGVVHDLATGQQSFFEGHTDDLSCICLAPGALGLVATGQVGKRPFVCLWDPSRTVPSASAPEQRQGAPGDSAFAHPYEVQEGGVVAKFGEGFFQRAVCAAAISYDGRFLCAIGSDDHHAMGIWDISTGELVAEAACHNGTPPQVRGVVWSPSALQAGYVGQDLRGSCDVLCTIGARHLKFWAFQRPAGGSRAPIPLLSRSHKMGKISLDLKPKEFTCVCFVPSSEEACDLLVGGSNGYVFLFRRATCVMAVDVFPRGVTRCLRPCASDSHVYVGGSGGGIVVLSMQTWAPLHAYSCMPPSKGAVGQTDVLGNPEARPRAASAGRIRPSSGVAAGGGRAKAGSSRKGGAKGPASAWSGPTEQAVDNTLSAGVKPSTDIIGLTLIKHLGGSKGRAGSLGLSSVATIVVVTGFGKCLQVDNTGGAKAPSPLFSFSYGPMWAAATPQDPAFRHLFMTGGDDRWLCLWNNCTFELETRSRARAPLRCIDIDPSTTFVAVGMGRGAIALYHLRKDLQAAPVQGSLLRRDTGSSFSLLELESRKDCLEDISDIKFSPNGKMLAVGSHDNFIDIYQCRLAAPTLSSGASGGLRQLKRLRGHSSYITHLDWSQDNHVIQSTCGAYELLFWDVLTGKQLLSTHDTLEADTAWSSLTCVLGFNVMGIWPTGSDGTDVNAVDVSRDKGLVATGDDFGNLSLFNYPCVVEGAPGQRCSGHSSHVMAVKFTAGCADQKLVTVGGNDNSAMTWAIV